TAALWVKPDVILTFVRGRRGAGLGQRRTGEGSQSKNHNECGELRFASHRWSPGHRGFRAHRGGVAPCSRRTKRNFPQSLGNSLRAVSGIEEVLQCCCSSSTSSRFYGQFYRSRIELFSIEFERWACYSRSSPTGAPLRPARAMPAVAESLRSWARTSRSRGGWSRPARGSRRGRGLRPKKGGRGSSTPSRPPWPGCAAR